MFFFVLLSFGLLGIGLFSIVGLLVFGLPKTTTAKRSQRDPKGKGSANFQGLLLAKFVFFGSYSANRLSGLNFGGEPDLVRKIEFKLLLYSPKWLSEGGYSLS